MRIYSLFLLVRIWEPVKKPISDVPGLNLRVWGVLGASGVLKGFLEGAL